jgi:hypothetical protein
MIGAMLGHSCLAFQQRSLRYDNEGGKLACFSTIPAIGIILL